MSFLQIDGTLWIQIVNFFIFYAILNVVYIKPAAEALRKRRAYIDSVQAEYETAIHQVRELKSEAESRRAAARREGEQKAASSRGEAQRQAEEITSAAQARAAEIVARALQTVEGELSTARTNEDALVKGLADTMLARAVGTL